MPKGKYPRAKAEDMKKIFGDGGKRTKPKTKKQLEEDEEIQALDPSQLALPTFDSPEERDEAIAVDEMNSLSDDELEDKDVFVEAVQKARARNTTCKFRIYRDGNLLVTKSGQYSWEKLQAEYGGGYFKIVAVDRDSRYITSQTMSLESPDGFTVGAKPVEQQGFVQQIPMGQVAQPQHPGPNTLEFLELMNQTKREAESKASEQSNGIAQVMATMMTAQANTQQAMMTMMNQSAQQFQTLLMESQKQQQFQAQESNKQMMNLFTTLLTKKDEGMPTDRLIKMLEDAKKDAKSEMRETFKLIEDKAEKMYEERSEAGESGDKDESLAKSLLKGFIPLATQALANGMAGQLPGQQGQPGAPAGNISLTPEQIREVQLRAMAEGERRQLQARGAKPNGQAGPARPVVNGNGKTPQPISPMPAGTPEAGFQPADERRSRSGGTVEKVVGSGGEPAGATANGAAKIIDAKPKAAVTHAQPGPLKVTEVPGGIMTSQKLRLLNAETKAQILDSVKFDIAHALISGKAAAETAEEILTKLESGGFARQTVGASFELSEFYRFAEANSVPVEAKPWIKDFHAAISQKSSPNPTGLRPSVPAQADA